MFNLGCVIGSAAPVSTAAGTLRHPPFDHRLPPQYSHTLRMCFFENSIPEPNSWERLAPGYGTPLGTGYGDLRALHNIQNSAPQKQAYHPDGPNLTQPALQDLESRQHPVSYTRRFFPKDTRGPIPEGIERGRPTGGKTATAAVHKMRLRNEILQQQFAKDFFNSLPNSLRGLNERLAGSSDFVQFLTDPQTNSLFIQADTRAGFVYNTSCLTELSCTLSQTLDLDTRRPRPLIYVCGHNMTPEAKHLDPGAQRIIENILYQWKSHDLLSVGEQRPDTGAYKFVRACFKTEPDLKALGSTLVKYCQEANRRGRAFVCMIDGIRYYENEPFDTGNMLYLLSQLLGLANTSRSCFKLLVTSHVPAPRVDEEFMKLNNQVIDMRGWKVPGSGPDRAGFQRQMEELVSNMPLMRESVALDSPPSKPPRREETIRKRR